MKIVYIYRHQRAGAFSIEAVFHTVASYNKKHHEVIEYVAGTRIEMFSDTLKLRSLDADIYHITGDVNYLAMFLPRHKVVLTVHDIGHLLYGLRGFKALLYKYFWFKLPLKYASKITTVSDETKRNLLNTFNDLTDKVFVVPNCYDNIFTPSAYEFNNACPTILQMSAKPYKNVSRLLDAIKGIKCKLVIVGKLPEDILQKLRDNGINYENLVGITNQEVFQSYVQADLVTFVSLGEGFGVPIIEAQAVGRPVITSNRAPMCEVAGLGAALADPLDIIDIRSKILQVINDPTYRAQLVNEGFQNVANYSTSSVCTKYINVYKGVCSNG